MRGDVCICCVILPSALNSLTASAISIALRHHHACLPACLLHPPCTQPQLLRVTHLPVVGALAVTLTLFFAPSGGLKSQSMQYRTGSFWVAPSSNCAWYGGVLVE